MTQQDYPVAVEQKVGEGKVMWTGANFWYRPEEYRENGVVEAGLTKIFLKQWLGDLSRGSRIEAEVNRAEPEEIWVKGEGIKGVVFKENHWPGWGAKVKSSGKTKRVPVFTAGPELMYVPVPKQMREGEIEVEINYHGGGLYWLCLVVSIVSLLVVVVYLIFGDKAFKGLKSRGEKKKGWGKKMREWWDKDEDE